MEFVGVCRARASALLLILALGVAILKECQGETNFAEATQNATSTIGSSLENTATFSYPLEQVFTTSPLTTLTSTLIYTTLTQQTHPASTLTPSTPSVSTLISPTNSQSTASTVNLITTTPSSTDGTTSRMLVQTTPIQTLLSTVSTFQTMPHTTTITRSMTLTLSPLQLTSTTVLSSQQTTVGQTSPTSLVSSVSTSKLMTQLTTTIRSSSFTPLLSSQISSTINPSSTLQTATEQTSTIPNTDKLPATSSPVISDSGAESFPATSSPVTSDRESFPATSSLVTSDSGTESFPTRSSAMMTSGQPQPTPPTATSTDDTNTGVLERIEAFFKDDIMIERTEVLVGVILGSVVIILLIVVACVGCCCLRSCRRKNKKKFDLTSQAPTTRNGVNPTYRPRSRMSVNEMGHRNTDAFYSDFQYQTASQPYHTTMATSSDSAFMEPLPTISPLSYPSQLRHYMHSPDRQEHASSPTPRISLTGSPGGLRRFHGGSPSLQHPTPLGQQLQKQAERNSTQGSRNSIQGSRASISAMGSRTSFSGSRNSFLSSNNTTSRDEMRSSGYLPTSNRTMSEEETSSQLGYRPLLRQTSLDMVPTRQSPIQLPPSHPSQEFQSMTCISNPLALQAEGEMEGREDGDGEDENDLRTDPLVPVMTSTPVNQEAGDSPTREGRQRKKEDGSWKHNDSDSVFMSPQKKNLRQLTSLTHAEGDGEGETSPPSVSEVAPRATSGDAGDEGDDESLTPKAEEKPKPKPMSRLEKLTSLDYIRSSIRRSLKKKRVSFLTRTPDSTPKVKKKTPPRTLPGIEPDFDPDPLTFSNQGAFDDSEGPMISPRIHTPSPLSPEFETVDEYPQRYPDGSYNMEVYPETHALRHPHPGVGVGGSGGARMRTYSDLPMFAPQLSQPAYYPSAAYYPQSNYPQLSQQYIPSSYVPPQPLSFMGSPAHRSYGPIPLQPGMHPPFEPYGRRYTADSVMGGGRPHMGGGRGAKERSSTDHHRPNRTKSPEAFTDTASNVSSRYDHVFCPDHYTDVSNISDVRVQSPDTHSSLVQGRGSFNDQQPLRFRSIPTSPEERPYSPQYYPHLPGGGGGGPYGHHSTHYRERSIDNPQQGAGIYRQSAATSNQQSPMHQYPRGRKNSTEYHPKTLGHVRQGSNEITGNHVHIRRSSIDTQPPIASHVRRNSIENQPSNTGTKLRRSSVDSSSSSRHTSVEIHPGTKNATRYQPILEPGPQRNVGMEVEEAWQYSQGDELSMQYGIGSQPDGMGLPGWEDKGDTSRDPESEERAVDASANTAKAKVSWNNEIIEHLRTPSDCSDRYDL